MPPALPGDATAVTNGENARTAPWSVGFGVRSNPGLNHTILPPAPGQLPWSLSLCLCKRVCWRPHIQAGCSPVSSMKAEGDGGSALQPLLWAWPRGALSDLAPWTLAGTPKPWPAQGSSNTAQNPVAVNVGRTWHGHPTIRQVGCDPSPGPGWDFLRPPFCPPHPPWEQEKL